MQARSIRRGPSSSSRSAEPQGARQTTLTLKAHLRKAAERTIHGLWNVIGRILDLYSPQECANYFANAGYDSD